MKIRDLEFFLVQMPQCESGGGQRSLLVRVGTASGLEGWGESTLRWRPDELGERREAMLAILAGRSIYDLEELHSLDALAPAPLRSAVEMAFWDLLGKSLRQPLCNLLGGYYRRRVPVSLGLTGCQVKTVVHVAREMADQGLHTQTIITSGNADEDIRNIGGIREMVGDLVEVRLDGQSSFDLETARDLCAGIEFEDVRFFIDPVKTTDVHALARLARQTNVPLAARQAIQCPTDVLNILRFSAAAYAVIDLERVGGIIPARQCAAVAAAGGLTPLLGGRNSIGIATAAMLHVAAATASLATANEIAPRDLAEGLLRKPFEITDGMISVPESPGLGVEIDRLRLEQYQPVM